MRTFKKSSKLDHVCYDVRGPVLDEANRMQADGIDVLKLNIGNPAPFGFSAPEEVITDMISTLRSAQKGNHAVCADKKYSKCVNGTYLYRKWCQ